MGMLVNVYRNADPAYGDCTNDGISSNHHTLCVINVSGPFTPNKDAPAVIMERHVPGCLRIVPCQSVNGQWVRTARHVSMGGNYAATSDSRFADTAEQLLGHRFYGAVAIHDRAE